MKQGGLKGKRPSGSRKQGGGKPSRKVVTGQKRKSEESKEPNAATAPNPASGDADDFMDMLNTMEDYRPVDDAAEDGSGSGLEPGTAGQPQGGSSDDEAAPAASPSEGGAKAKKRRKRGQKLSAIEFEARRDMVKRIADCPAEEQADWLWASYQQHAAASTLERGGLTAQGMAALPASGSLEQRLKTLRPADWQQALCGGGRAHPAAARGEEQPPAGSPSLLLVSPSAIGAVGLIKLCPSFHKACRIAKLFAKHMKVPEQVELLRSQVVCIGAGTPNRLCKLADEGALRLGRLRHVVLDLQLDAKQRDILAIPETRADWWAFFDRHLKQRLDDGSLKLSLINSDHVQGN